MNTKVSFKTCTSCGISKPPEDYHKFGNGLRPTCKPCTNYQNREIYRKNREKHLKAKRNYRINNPEARRKTLEKYEESRKQERNAWSAVRIEIENGNLPRVSDLKCEHCSNKAQTYHHWSYEESHWLDVIPLCRECHGKEHQLHV